MPCAAELGGPGCAGMSFSPTHSAPKPSLASSVSCPKLNPHRDSSFWGLCSTPERLLNLLSSPCRVSPAILTLCALTLPTAEGGEGAAYRLPHGLLSLLSVLTQGHLPLLALSPVGWATPAVTINQGNAPWANLRETFSQWRYSLFRRTWLV